MNNPTTIFFPDISGFTEFVNQTEIEHGQHIIASLLEEIIESNYLDFIVSEIEGDAILFYKGGDKLSTTEILKLCIDIYNKFHEKLKELDNSTNCECGACSSISKLKLKFIIHFGKVSFIKIYNFEKLYGLDVIIAHRLLKNNIPSKEYVLITNSSNNPTQNSAREELEFLEGPFNFRQQIPIIGAIEGIYYNLLQRHHHSTIHHTHN
ncbi:MAG: DUF2652 domain-containing protein [Ignavibacteriaceae bacterium]|jgi:hypothetical protein